MKKIFLALGFLALTLWQGQQLFSFNPYWGYDGGAHVQYIESLLEEGRFPSLEENYLAWHEPLYYLVQAGLGAVHIPVKMTHLVIVVAVTALSYFLYRRGGVSWLGAGFLTLLVAFLPAFRQIALFSTNEALNYLFLLAIMLVTVRLWQKETFDRRDAGIFILLIGFAMVTKITAVIALGVSAILLFIKWWQTKNWRYGATVLMATLFAVICYVPWLMVRSDNLSRLSVNNYDMLPAKVFAFDERFVFLSTFDADVLRFPFWYSGGRGFWSMLYADTVSDYYGFFENQDVLRERPVEEKIATTHSNTWVSAYRKPLATSALALGVFPVALILAGVGFALRDFVRERFSTNTLALPVLGYSFAFLLALLYYAYRYPYPELGVVKSIFIAPAFVLPIGYGWMKLQSSTLRRFVMPAFVIGLSVYVMVSAQLFFIA